MATTFAYAASRHPRKRIFVAFSSRFLQSLSKSHIGVASVPSCAATLAGFAFPATSSFPLAFSPVAHFSSGGTEKGGAAATVRVVSKKRPRRKLVPKKYAVALTPEARSLFNSLLGSATDDVVGIMFNYGQSKGSLGMGFSFGFARESDIGEDDERVSLEILPSGETKAPADAQNDGLPKLYVSSDALLKVLGCTIDIDKDGISPLVLDAEGYKLDPNA